MTVSQQTVGSNENYHRPLLSPLTDVFAYPQDLCLKSLTVPLFALLQRASYTTFA